MNKQDELEKTQVEMNEKFEAYWRTAPVYPIKAEHERHKIASESAFYAGYVGGIIEGMELGKEHV